MKVHQQDEGELKGRWIAEVPGLPGVLVHGNTREEAMARAQEVAERASTRKEPPPAPTPRRRAVDKG
jgi:predicted RNase H-like HicB family nuclease